MTIEPRELLLKMKQYEFVYDTKIGQVMNPKADEDKEYVLKILDLLYENFDRVRYVDDMGSKYTGKNAWAVMLSQKFAVLDKRMPIKNALWNYNTIFSLHFYVYGSFSICNRNTTSDYQ
jgi:hypothetical protein